MKGLGTLNIKTMQCMKTGSLQRLLLHKKELSGSQLTRDD